MIICVQDDRVPLFRGLLYVSDAKVTHHGTLLGFCYYGIVFSKNFLHRSMIEMFIQPTSRQLRNFQNNITTFQNYQITE